MRNSSHSHKPLGVLLLIGGVAVIVAFLLKPPSQPESVADTGVAPKSELDAAQQTAALVLIDIQKDFWIPEVSGSHPNFEASVSSVLAQCRESGVPVLHVRTQFDDKLTNWPAKFQSVHHSMKLCLKGTEGEQPLECSVVLQNEPVFVKGNFDAFSNLEFERTLKQLGVEKIYVCGLYTDVCVLSSCLSAFNKGYEVTVISDCCASVEASHAFVLGRYSDFIFTMQQSADAIAGIKGQ